MDNKAVVRAYVEQVWGKNNLAAIDQYVAPDYVQHSRGAPPGREGVKAFFATLGAAFSDLAYSIEDMIAEGDKVCWRWVMKGRHTGTFLGMPATGKPISVTGLSVVRMAGGKMAEHWGEQDMVGLLQQIGILPGGGR